MMAFPISVRSASQKSGLELLSRLINGWKLLLANIALLSEIDLRNLSMGYLVTLA